MSWCFECPKCHRLGRITHLPSGSRWVFSCPCGLTVSSGGYHDLIAKLKTSTGGDSLG